MVTFAQLRDLKCAELEEAADAWGTVSNQASASREKVDTQILAKLREELEGEAAKEATKRLRLLSRNYQYINVECGLIRTTLNGLATELARSQQKLTTLLEEAAAQKCTILDNGTVRPQDQESETAARNAARAGDTSALRDSPQTHAREIAERLRTILSDAAETDARYAKTLSRLRTNGDLTITTPMWDDALKDMNAVRKAVGDYLPADSIPQDMSPRENADWWNALSQEERDAYVSLHPASIGALDGIPAEVRDTANRTVLVESYADTKAKLADHLADEPARTENTQKDGMPVERSEWRDWEKERKYLKGQLKGMEAIQKRFDKTGVGGLPEAYLLGFDTEGLGRAIIANGNPDTADHTGVYVPGTGANLANSGKDIRRSDSLWRQIDLGSGGSNVSTITWIGYDAPQSAIPVVDGDTIPEARSPSYAYDAAPALNQFMAGLEAVQGGVENSHTTLIGHSYGSTAIGAASLDGDLVVDDIVAVGSPGMLVNHADQLDVDKGHVWSQAAGVFSDQVPALGEIVGLGNNIQSPLDYLTQRVPSEEGFGANIMATEAEDHGDYWEPGSDSIRNQAAVILGQYDEVTR